jgi:CBS domain-containing protein
MNAAKIMMEQNVGSLPVVEDDRLVGMVTRTDLLRTIVL